MLNYHVLTEIGTRAQLVAPVRILLTKRDTAFVATEQSKIIIKIYYSYSSSEGSRVQSPWGGGTMYWLHGRETSVEENFAFIECNLIIFMQFSLI